MAKLVIDNDQLAEEYFADAKLFGVQCPLEPSRFVWCINQQFLYNFRYQPGAEIEFTRKGRKFRYPIFQCKEPQMQVMHFIYANQHDGEYLLGELKHYDYIWLIKGDLPDDALSTLIFSELKSIEQVQLVTELSNEKIVNKTQLVL